MSPTTPRRRLRDQAGFPNLLVKIPGTPQGLTAMKEAITAGIGVNVTLLFSDTHYLRTADAYLRARTPMSGKAAKSNTTRQYERPGTAGSSSRRHRHIGSADQRPQNAGLTERKP
jgi:hypothetical protein